MFSSNRAKHDWPLDHGLFQQTSKFFFDRSSDTIAHVGGEEAQEETQSCHLACICTHYGAPTVG